LIVRLLLWGWALGVATAALRDFGGASRNEPPHVFRRNPGVAPGRPHVRLANAEGRFGHKLAPPLAILREGGPFGEGGCVAVRARSRSA
jgi:hypothetical protein